jgi:cell division initiation protein
VTLTPVEIRHLKPAKSLVGGYTRTAVDALMDEIVVSFEDVWRERADLADKVEQLEADLVRYRELESLLRTTLVSAEKSAVSLREARAITRAARADHDRLLAEVRRMRSLLHSALALVDEEPPGKTAEAEAA